MTEQDLRRLEGEIGRSLSPAVRTFFLNFPPELLEVESDPDDDDFLLMDDADALIEMNRPGKHFYQPIDWTPRMFILGAGGCGETFWVDLDSEHGTVYRFDAGQEAEDSDEMADSLEEFAGGSSTGTSKNEAGAGDALVVAGPRAIMRVEFPASLSRSG